MASIPQSESAAAAGKSLEGIAATLRTLPRSLWLDLARADQSARWRSGHGLPVEKYFLALTELTADRDEMLVLVCGEIHLRQERGEQPELDEYLRRFPNLSDDLELQFELDRLLDGQGPADDDEVNGQRATIALPGFETLEEIGHGATGVVYLCRQKSLNRLVAVKAFTDCLPGSKHLARRRQEAEILSRLRLANVVYIYEVIEHAGRLHLVMEYVDGQSLTERIAGTPVDALEAARLTAVLAKTIDEVHQAGVLHRDLKPSNILLAADGRPKITDFGLAKLLSSDIQLTSENSLLGTPSYMAPEQAAGGGLECGPECDVYSLGAILYELLTGRPPFLGATVLETLTFIREREPVAPRELHPTTPRDLETICLKCLAKSPQQRYRTAGELAGDLRRYIEHRPILARRPSRVAHTWMWARRNPALAVVSAALVLSLAAGFTGIAWKWREAEVARKDAQAAQTEADARADEIREGLENLQSANALLDRGRVFTERTRWDDADAAFTKALSLRADLAPAWAERGQLYAQLGLWDLAAADLTKVHELQAPTLARDWWHGALLLAHNGDEAGYQRLCEGMWERFAGTTDASFTRDLVRTLSLLPSGRHDRRKNLSLVEEAVAAEPGDARGRFILALACYRAGDFGRAARECEAIVSSADKKAVQAVVPVLALSYHALGRMDDARESFDKASDAMESALTESYKRKTRNWVIDKGVADDIARSVWDWLEFVQYFREAQGVMAVSQPREDPRPLVARARALAGLRRFDHADREYEKALKLTPDDARLRLESHRNRGYVFAETGDLQKSAVEFGKASAMDRTDSDLWRFYAAAQAAAGDMAGYRQTCEAMLIQLGETIDRGEAYDLVHSCVLVPDAVPDMAQLMALAETASTWSVGAKRMKGAACYRAGRYKEALTAITGGAKGQRFRPVDMCFAAMAHERLGQHEAAVRQLAEAEAWMNEADEQELDDLTGLTPHWGHWHERYDARRLAAEARELIEGGETSGE